MPRPSDTPAPLRAPGLALLATALALAGCSSTPARSTAPVVAVAAVASATPSIVRDDAGFTLAETAEVPPQARADYDNAMSFLRAGQHASGIALLLRVTEAAPKLAGPFVDLGIALGMTGELDKAEESLRRALEINPRHPAALNELGRTLRRKGQFAAARESYERALQEAPELHFAHLNLAILCDLYLADLQCALEHYTAYQQAVPGDRQAASWVAEVGARARR